MDELKGIITVGCPAYFNASSSQENFRAFAQYGNHSTIVKNIAKVMKTLTKKCSTVLSFPFLIGSFPFVQTFISPPMVCLLSLKKR